MALVSVQISSGAVVHLPWNIVGEYNSSCTLGELYESIKTGSIPIDMWEFPSKFDKIKRVNAVLDKVFVRQNISCRNAIEVPYFSSKSFPAVCYYCGAKENLKHEEGAYPCCELCTASNSVPNKRKHNIWKENQNKKQKTK